MKQTDKDVLDVMNIALKMVGITILKEWDFDNTGFNKIILKRRNGEEIEKHFEVVRVKALNEYNEKGQQQWTKEIRRYKSRNAAMNYIRKLLKSNLSK